MAPKGADLNPIENVWAEMVRSLDAQQVSNGNNLWDKVSDIWNQFSRRPTYWQCLCNSMGNRLALVREVNGNWTKY